MLRALLTNAIVTWNTECSARSLRTLVGEGQPVDDTFVAHRSPTALDHSNRYGPHTFEVDAEFRRLGDRPWRTPEAV